MKKLLALLLLFATAAPIARGADVQFDTPTFLMHPRGHKLNAEFGTNSVTVLIVNGTNILTVITNIAQLVSGATGAYQPQDETLTLLSEVTTAPFGRSVLETASQAALRTLLALTPGTDVQGYDADLAALAGLTTTPFGRSVLETANQAALQALLGLTPGTDVQEYHANLAALAAIAGQQGDIIYHNGTAWTRLPKGTAAQVLTMNGSATAPSWAAPTGGGGGGGTADVSYFTNSFSWQNRGFFSTATSTNIAIDAGTTDGRKEVGILAGTSFQFYLTNALANTNHSWQIALNVTNTTIGNIYATNVTDALDPDGNWGTMYPGKNTILLTYDGFSVSVSQNTAKHSRDMVEGQTEKDADQDSRLDDAETDLQRKLDPIGDYAETTPESTDEVIIRRPGTDQHYKALISALTGGAGYDAIVAVFATNAIPTPIYTNEAVAGYIKTANLDINVGAPTNSASFKLNGSIWHDGTSALIATNRLTYNGILEQRHTASTNPTVYWVQEGTNAVAYFDGGLTNEQFHVTSWVRLQSITNHTYSPGGLDNLTNGMIFYGGFEAAGGGDLTNELNSTETFVNTGVGGSTSAGFFKVGTRAANFESSESDRYVASSPTMLDFKGDQSFTISFQANLESTNAAQTWIGKWNASTADRQYRVYYSSVNDRWVFEVSNNGTVEVQVIALNAGSPGIGTFQHVIAWHDADADIINISVNGSSESAVAHTSGIFDGSAGLAIGYRPNTAYADGQMDELAFWDRILTPTERTTARTRGNSGTPLYP
jgi:hypothetical protein